MYNSAAINFSEITFVIEAEELHDSSTPSLMMAGVGLGLAVVSAMFLFGFSATGLIDLIESLPIKAVLAYTLLVLAGLATIIMHAGMKNQPARVMGYGAVASFISGAVYHATLLQC